MSTTIESGDELNRALILTRILDAPREAVFRAWKEPELLAQWWAPRPFRVTHCTIDFRAGGMFSATMRGADGTDYPHSGVFLEIVAPEKIVFTDAFSEAWIPSAKPFMTAVVTLEDLDGKTKYTARALHWTVADRAAHEAMGFHDGWGRCADQLAVVAGAL